MAILIHTVDNRMKRRDQPLPSTHACSDVEQSESIILGIGKPRLRSHKVIRLFIWSRLCRVANPRLDIFDPCEQTLLRICIDTLLEFSGG